MNEQMGGCNAGSWVAYTRRPALVVSSSALVSEESLLLA